MIFVTVGSQMPFDRLVQAVDDWAALAPGRRVFAQIGIGGQPPAHLEWAETLPPAEFDQRLRDCDLVVAHAGCGAILSALSTGKPLVVMPRRGHLRETRNDHQVATAAQFRARYDVAVACDGAEMAATLDRLCRGPGSQPPIRPHASDELLACLRTFLAAD